MRTMTSELLRIPGVGETKRRQLLEAFGSLQGVRDASIGDIAALPGFGEKTAERILAALREGDPVPSRSGNGGEARDGADARDEDGMSHEAVDPITPATTPS